MPKCDIIYLDLKKGGEKIEIIIIFILLHFNFLYFNTNTFSLWALLGPSEVQQVFYFNQPNKNKKEEGMSNETKVPEVLSIKFSTECGVIALTDRGGKVFISSFAPATDGIIPMQLEAELRRRFAILKAVNTKTPVKEPDRQPRLFPIPGKDFPGEE